VAGHPAPPRAGSIQATTARAYRDGLLSGEDHDAILDALDGDDAVTAPGRPAAGPRGRPRERGVGDEAVWGVVAWASDKYPGSSLVLSVKSDNTSACWLYERHGFVDAGPSAEDPTELANRSATASPSGVGEGDRLLGRTSSRGLATACLSDV